MTALGNCKLCGAKLYRGRVMLGCKTEGCPGSIKYKKAHSIPELEYEKLSGQYSSYSEVDGSWDNGINILEELQHGKLER